ncbi:MAG: flagellar motility protein MotE (MotC chaperone) [Candidatus Krumholzibacteriia bacterium]|jgi:flagellar motility protein MotE (MotC chaperone)
MKSVLIISIITFILIFGGVVGISTQLKQQVGSDTNPELTADDYAAAERVFHDMAVERDRIQQDREGLLALGQSIAVQEQVLEQGRESLLAVIKKLDSKQQEYVAERERSATKLAKMYEAMKPQQAAPILGALDMDIVLDIMSRMKERQAAKILAKMDAGFAAQISTRMSLKGNG